MMITMFIFCLLEVQQNHGDDLWQWTSKWHLIPEIGKHALEIQWSMSIEHDRCDFFRHFLFRYVFVLNPLNMVYICIVQHSNLQLKCKFSIVFEVHMLL
jgi:hypothetical protein